MSQANSRRWIPALLVVATVAGLGFVAGRRYPFERLNRMFAGTAAVRPGAWDSVSVIPLTRYELASAVWNGRVYLFGGFWNRKVQATSRVDVWDPGTRTWSRAGDLPRPLTHVNAQLVGDTIWFAGGFVGDHPGPATDRVEGYAPATDTWFDGPPLPAPRGGGALVADGRTLHYYGGFGPDREAGRGEHWMLDLDAWLARGTSWVGRAPLPVPRGHHAGIRFGRILYAIGGNSPHDPHPVDLDRVDRYDPVSDTWTQVASLPFPLSHTEPGTFVRDRMIWVVGGRDLPDDVWQSPSILRYDPSEDRWHAWKSLPLGLLAPVAKPIGDDLFVAGGANPGSSPENVHAVWQTSMAAGWWSAASMPRPLAEVAGGLLDDRLILVGEGSDVTLSYDLRSGRWENPGRLARRPALGHHHAAEVVGGRLYLLGGLGAGGRQMQIYDAAANRWSLGPDLPFQAGSSASAVIGGRIYLAGGIDGDSTIAAGAVFDPATEAWSAIAPMPRPRNHAASATDGVQWYVFGGRGPGSGDANVVANGFSDVQVYDPALNRWTVSGSGPDAPAPLPVGRGGMGKAAFANGRFYVIGGETLDGPGANRNGVYQRVDVYDPRTNQWTEGPPLPTARHGIFPLAAGGRIYVAGGGDRAGASATTALEVLDLPRSP